MAMKKTSFSADRLAASLRAIRGACKEYALDDDTRKAIMKKVVGQHIQSSTQLTLGEANRVLDYLYQTYGKKPTTTTNEWSFVDTAPADRQPVLRRIIVFCRDLGITRGCQVAYVEGIARQMAGLNPGQAKIEKPLPMCDLAELRKIATALDYQQNRKSKARA